jgi:transposase
MTMLRGHRQAEMSHILRSNDRVSAAAAMIARPPTAANACLQEFASYARLIKCTHESGGKKLGTGGAKMGNVHLKWAFSEAAVTFLRHNREGQKMLACLRKKHGKGKALSILAHKIGRAVFYMLSRGTLFSMEKFRAA